MTRIGSLCSGYEGIGLGLADALGINLTESLAWHVEYDEAPSRILAHHFPGIPNYGDVKETCWPMLEPVDWLTAGYPCQPFSTAGKRKGTDDPRHLWPNITEAIRVLRPHRVLLENVPGHLSLGFGTVLGDLAAIGYDARWIRLPASVVGAPHLRKRLYVIATDANSSRLQIRPSVPGDPCAKFETAQRGNNSSADTESIGWPERRSESARLEGRLCPTERSNTPITDAAGKRLDGRTGVESDGRLPSVGSSQIDDPSNCDSSRNATTADAESDARRLIYGDYSPTVERWERLTRPAPRPTELNSRGNWRLSPRFAEWMMGLPDGWVTSPEIGLTRSQQLKAIGNGVVPQQCAEAVRYMLSEEMDAA